MPAVTDLALIGLLAIGVASLMLAVYRVAHGRSGRLYVVSLFGSLALVTVWVGSAGYVVTDSAWSGDAEVTRTAGEQHDHDEMFADDGELRGSEMLAEHLSHLGETSLVVTQDQQAAAELLKSATQLAIRPYARMADAEAQGYVRLNDADTGREQLFLYDREFVREGTWIEPGRPQALVYLRAPSATYELVGAAFLTPAGEGPPLGGGLTIWFPHRDLCLDSEQYIVAKARPGGGCLAGSEVLGWRVAALYVWLFDNPNGSFAGGLTREAADIFRRQRTSG